MRLPKIEKGLFQVMLLALMCVFFFIFHIWIRTLAITSGYRVGELRREIVQLESELSSGKVERNRLMGPESLQNLVRDFDSQGIVFQAPKTAQLIYTKSRQ